VRGGLYIFSGELPINLSFSLCEQFTLPSATLESGAQEVFPINDNARLEPSDTEEIEAHRAGFYYIGEIVYVDGANIRRITGFCRRYYPSERRWESINSQYEYSN